MTPKTQGHFCLFITHALRILIIFMIIDNQSLSLEQEEEPSLTQVIRKYSDYSRAFPLNEPLIEALKGDYVW
eukprot:CAMPEP_0116878816 /NCGR_PEP_ID=MMETSP0463-20121206/10573_1 /TAXON_ID=181622 /ORGANISM="Strombidinopsis sp, Strain SopsisLIS2011" /LENGTH=71 /DNA_ID=CAMNT_0004527429 /DNA_START=1505 /DNA_END=1717 /DNA_ORIENTATION=-